MTTLQEAPDENSATGQLQPVETAPEPVVEPIRGSALALVKHMQNSLTVPTATTMRTFSVRGLDRVRARLEVNGRQVSVSRLIAYALVRAAAERPGITHRYIPSDRGGSRALDGQINLGLAVDVAREDGTRQVLVPVIAGADRHNLDGFIAAYDDIINRSRTSGLEAAQMQGANLILTNTGAFGSTTGVPRLPAGPGAIVAVGTIGYPAGFEEIAEDLGISRICTVSSTYDHRVIQGADSGLFLKEFATALASEDAPLWADVLAGVPELPTAAGKAAARPQLHAVTLADEPSTPAAHQYATAVLDAIQELHRLRREGYKHAHLDPLADAPPLPTARPDAWSDVTTTALGMPGPERAFVDAFPDLVAAWCGPLAPDVWHLRNAHERTWWATRVEAPTNGPTADERRGTLDRLIAIETLERFMQRGYTGHKTLSVEGLDVTVLIGQVLMDLAHDAGMGRLNIGMAHRGRVNVLAHITQMPYQRLFSEFEQSNREDALNPAGTNGDVKQHLGFEAYIGDGSNSMAVAMLPNPSHLEFVSPVVLGATRAHLDGTTPAAPDTTAALAVLMHGDAAFTGQGVVSETFNLHRTPGFTVGGAIHIVQDNQVGFTTTRTDLRSTEWPSDAARGYDVPILHVNADDADAAVRAAKLAFEFRNEFGKDVVIHVVGYRRLGHTETDEPTFTQAKRYEAIAGHPSVATKYTSTLEAAGVIHGTYAEQVHDDLVLRMQEAQRAAADEHVTPAQPHTRLANAGAPAIPVEDLRRFANELLTVPEATTPHVKVKRVLDKRRSMLADDLIDWPHAETLAFAQIARSGRKVRLTGQDVVRGTFTQRHATLHDVQDPANDYSPLFDHPETGGRARIWRSPLTETAVLGYEYGYSVGSPEDLVLWEAQFGDFANGGQVITDQFIAGGHIKWDQRSRLTMLLPHGYDGAGPEHSSARVERFLQLAGEDNLKLVMPTTPAQYYSLLLEQAVDPDPRPLVVFTPKSLLRHKLVVSSLGDLAAPKFNPVLAATTDDPNTIRTVLLCAGKVYYDLLERSTKDNLDHVAVARVEQLYPFPAVDIDAELARYPYLSNVAWVQEEPQNMGAFTHVAQQLATSRPDLDLTYIGRPTRAATAEGYGSTHRRVQADIVERGTELGRKS
jgi:2-oxoglutarate decarboxylase